MSAPIVAIVYAGYLARGTGVAQHIRQLTAAFQELGVKPDVWSLERLPWGVRLLPHVAQRSGNAWRVPRGFFWRYRLGRWLYRRRIAAAVKDRRIDAVIFEDVFTMFPVEAPALCVLHALQSHNLQAHTIAPEEMAAARQRERDALRGAACPVVTVSEPYLRTVRADLGAGADAVGVVPLGLDVRRFPLIPEPRHSSRLEIVFVAYLEARKNLWFLPKLLAELVDRALHAHLTIVGDGPQRDTLARELASQNLTQHVTMTGRVPHDAIPSMLQQFHLMVHPTAVESFAFTLLEGRLAGLWTMSSEGLDVPESFSDARLPLDARVWADFIVANADAIRRAPSPDRLAAIARARVEFSSTRMAAAYLDRLGLRSGTGPS